MICTPSQFRAHFSDYADRFFILTKSDSYPSLNKKERKLLNDFGLPDCGLPFFFFDFTLQYTRDIDVDNAIFILGSAVSANSPHYIYIDTHHHVRVIDDTGNDHYLNDSLESFYNYLFTYSRWLESLEHRAQIMGEATVTYEEVFDVYYDLRSLDKSGMHAESIWYNIVQTELMIETDSAEVI